MKRLLSIALVFVPVLAFGQTATAAQKVGWDQDAADLSTASGYTYKIYIDGATTGVTLAGVVCVNKVPALPNTFDCSATFPAVTPGPHTMMVTANNQAGESPKSAPLSFTFVAVPTAPANLRIR